MNSETNGSSEQSMRLTDDLKDPSAVVAKGWLFLILGLLSAGILLAIEPNWQIALLLVISVWAFCRWYYFMFYVIERYVEPEFKFAGLGLAIRFLIARRNANSND